MKKKWKWLSAVVLVVFLQACQQQEEKSVKEPETEAATGYTVTDDLGEKVTFAKVPETVVSLQPSNTEILFALGVGEKVVGATDYDNYPEAASKIERVSDSMTINAEKIIAMDPDVVIAYTTGDEAGIEPLKEAGIPVFVIESAGSFEDVYGDIEQIADVMGASDKGDELVAEIRGHIEEVESKVANVETKKKVYLEISPAPDIYTTGAETFQQEILAAAGVENVFAGQSGWIKVSEEDVVNVDPELIATTVNYVEDPIGEIKGRTAWAQLQAVESGQVFMLDSDIMSRPGPRIDEAVELVAKMAYPELFQ